MMNKNLVAHSSRDKGVQTEELAHDKVFLLCHFMVGGKKRARKRQKGPAFILLIESTAGIRAFHSSPAHGLVIVY